MSVYRDAIGILADIGKSAQTFAIDPNRQQRVTICCNAHLKLAQWEVAPTALPFANPIFAALTA
jgi:hypothetical protein